jgi:hypothetical protein
MFKSTFSWPRHRLHVSYLRFLATFFLGKHPDYPFYTRLGLPQGRSGLREEFKILEFAEIRTSTPQSSSRQSLYRLRYCGSHLRTESNSISVTLSTLRVVLHGIPGEVNIMGGLESVIVTKEVYMDRCQMRHYCQRIPTPGLVASRNALVPTNS